MVEELPRCVMESNRSLFEVDFKVFLEINSSLFCSPILSPMVIDLLRGIPVCDQDVIEGFQESIWKEIKICEAGAEEDEDRINFAPFFDDDARYESVLPELPPNPYMARYFHNALVSWRNDTSSRIHYPRATDKSMAWSTWREYEASVGGVLGFDQELPMMMTQKVWLRHYHLTGEKLLGCSEMRVRWYEANAKPRTYYAMGGLHYSKSMYLQDPFTDLVNTNEMTHHITRLQPSRIRLKYGQHVRIYDFTSFTSKMSTQKRFLYHLAEFSRGYPFVYFDPRKGVVVADMGDMLEEYWESCAVKPILSYDRVAKRMKISPGSLPRQNTASMLGIFGNLMSCTFLHACIVGQAIEDETQGRVAGDDASIAEDDNNAHYLDCAACSVGVYERSKSFNTLEPPCVALKRPLSQIPGTTIVHAGFNIIPPSLIQLLRVADPSHHDARYSVYDPQPRLVHLNRLGKVCLRYLRNIYFRRDQLLEEDVWYGLQFVRMITEKIMEWGENVALEGRFPTLFPEHPIFWPLVPGGVEELLERDPLSRLINRWYDGTIEVTRRGTNHIDSYLRFAGDSAIGNNSKWISLMVTLRYIEAVPSRVVLYDEEGYNFLIRTFNESTPILYDFVVVKDIPEHLYNP